MLNVEKQTDAVFTLRLGNQIIKASFDRRLKEAADSIMNDRDIQSLFPQQSLSTKEIS